MQRRVRGHRVQRLLLVELAPDPEDVLPVPGLGSLEHRPGSWPAMKREAWVVLDLGFGDAGKGSLTDFLVRERSASLVVRFNGGAQAGHNVVTADGRHHTFSQFGA